ncbi:MAG: hypothetical protein ACPG46_01060 [Thalassotalea sp.]
MSQKKALLILATSLSLMSTHTLATDFEITPLIGYTNGADLATPAGDNDISLSSGANIGIGIAWQDTPTGQGQVLINYVSHDFKSDIDQKNESLDILYTHFNGVAQFRQQDYLTTLSLGLGGAYFQSDFNEELYASATIAIGTQYKINEQFSFVTELRGYATLVDKDDNLFCQMEQCQAQFEDSVFMETSLSIGIAYRF